MPLFLLFYFLGSPVKGIRPSYIHIMDGDEGDGRHSSVMSIMPSYTKYGWVEERTSWLSDECEGRMDGAG